MVSSEVWDFHDVQQGELREVHCPQLRDDLQILSFSFGQVFVWGEHAIDLTISEVEVAKL
jgi:hypothetical protein